jgi:Tol biopolymer transport system component/tRNA A-37 threonylcarbamoyl transferase component Bud32
MDEPVPTVISHYRILRRLGAGGMGEVYLAEDSLLGRKVAIKVLPARSIADEKARSRLIREARTAARLDHPNICAIHEVGEDQSLSFIVMQHVEGETLAERMGREPLELNEALDVAVQVADALAEAHALGIIHRDLKPSNVMLTARGQAKVMDFGLAKLALDTATDTEASTDLMLTDSGTVVGTAPYMSPEQVRGEALDTRSDLFSFGALLYEAVSGRQPFAAESRAATFSAVLTREPLPLVRFSPQAPEELERIVAKALAKDREQRYQSAKDLFIDLRRLKQRQEFQSAGLSAAQSETTAGRVASSAAHTGGGVTRHKTAAMLGGVLIAVAAVVYLYSVIRQRPQAEQPPPQRVLSRLTFDAGLQSEPAWSPDGRFLAYSSDRGGHFEIYVQPVGEGNAVQITHSPAHAWQPAWSPDGKRIAFRSEGEGSGLYLVPALGGSQRKISSFGYHPRWSPDGARILFDMQITSLNQLPSLYTTALDGGEPRGALTDFLKDFAVLSVGYVAWYPDSQRVSVWATHKQLGRGFWTVPVGGGEPVRSEVSPEVEKRVQEAGVALGRFIWSPSRRALYFEGASRGVINLWKITVDPKTLRWIAGPERLTTGPGIDSDVALSPDGKKLAFTTRREETRIWVLPFDAAAGQVKGAGQPETPAGIEAWAFDLSRDGKKLAYFALRPGKQELWERILDGGTDKLLLASDSYTRTYPIWSPDGTRLAYRRRPPAKPGEPRSRGSIVVLPDGGGDEQVITSEGFGDGPKDWFADGQRLLALTNRPDGDRYKIWIVPLAAAPNGDARAQAIAQDPDYNFYQPHLSPDGRWICFLKVRVSEPGVHHIYVMPASGGEQTQITTGRFLDDKPRWSPDGKTIFFLSQRGGFFNVWGIHFAPASGKPVGEPFRVTAFESSARMATPANQASEMSVTANRLALPLTELSGSMWILENVDR